jgi:hypothetical protein
VADVQRLPECVRRSAGLAFLAAAAIGLAACGGSSPSRVASLGTSTDATTNSTATGSDRSSTTERKDNGPTALVDAWAACMRRHGDPNQADPVIDSHGVINITMPAPGQAGPPSPSAGGDAHAGIGRCSRYLNKAQVQLRAEDPVQDPQGVPTSTAVPFANCMRANGVPNYPYPSGPDDRVTNFNGTGVNPNIPAVEKVNDYCGKKLGLPTWWINGWGPPGDISVRSSLLPGAAGDCAYSKKGCGPQGGAARAFAPGAGAVGNSGVAAGG